MYLPFLYENFICLSLFKMLHRTILTCSLKLYVIGNKFFQARTSLNPISMNISFTMKDYSLHTIIVFNTMHLNIRQYKPTRYLS